MWATSNNTFADIAFIFNIGCNGEISDRTHNEEVDFFFNFFPISSKSRLLIEATICSPWDGYNL